MKRDHVIPPIQVDKDLKDWICEQADKSGLLITPWVRQLLMDIKSGRVKIVHITHRSATLHAKEAV